VAAILAGFSAFTFAELGARLPRSAGAALYVREGLGSVALARLTGVMVASAGIITAATITTGAVGYAQLLVDAPHWMWVAIFVVALVALAAWGIQESVTVAATFTVIEIGIILTALWFGRESLGEIPAHIDQVAPPIALAPWGPILAAAAVAFFAYLGFEDMVNVAEEVKDVSRTLPIAILLTLGVSTALYVCLSLVAVLSLPLSELAASEAPMVLLLSKGMVVPPAAAALITLFAVLNGALIQIIMGARMLYGMTAEGWVPGPFGRVHPRTQTPVIATIVVGGLVLVLAAAFDVVILAEMASTLVLSIFALANLSLWRLKIKAPGPGTGFTVPIWVPAIGFVVSAGFVVYQVLRALGI
jgi:amino acid transporter